MQLLTPFLFDERFNPAERVDNSTEGILASDFHQSLADRHQDNAIQKR